MHAVAAIGTVWLAAALVVPSVMFGRASAEQGPVLDDMVVIEASLAYKKPNAPKQPQKPKKTNPEVKPEGVSRDENKPVEDKKDKKDEPKSKNEDPLQKFRREEDDSTGTAEPDVGAFDGSEFGFADETKGDPYVGRIVADLARQFNPPELARESGTPPIGCIQLLGDGTIKDTTFKQESGDDLQPSSEQALKALVKLRNQNPIPVPTHLLRQLTTRWLCFNFKTQLAK
ncbi:MAG: hypothetical protein AB7P03_17225 [Kofleriaceae bacterium]